MLYLNLEGPRESGLRLLICTLKAETVVTDLMLKATEFLNFFAPKKKTSCEGERGSRSLVCGSHRLLSEELNRLPLKYFFCFFKRASYWNSLSCNFGRRRFNLRRQM